MSDWGGEIHKLRIAVSDAVDKLDERLKHLEARQYVFNAGSTCEDGLMGTKIEPIRGVFEDWRSLLAHLMEIDEIESVVVVTVHKDGTMHSAHLGFTAQPRAPHSSTAVIPSRHGESEEQESR